MTFMIAPLSAIWPLTKTAHWPSVDFHAPQRNVQVCRIVECRQSNGASSGDICLFIYLEQEHNCLHDQRFTDFPQLFYLVFKTLACEKQESASLDNNQACKLSKIVWPTAQCVLDLL